MRQVVQDAASIDDIDYSAGLALNGLLDYLASKEIQFAVAGADPVFLQLLDSYGVTSAHPGIAVFPDATAAIDDWREPAPAP